MAARNLTFDDRDESHLVYESYWFHEGSWNASHVGKTGTLSSTELVDASVTFTFPEPANAFYYFGIPRCCGGLYAICIDCDPNSPNFIEIDAVNASDDGQNPPVLLFKREFDDYGIHEIILKNQNDTRFGKSQLTIDRFVLQVENFNVSVSSGTSSSSRSETGQGSLGRTSSTGRISTPTTAQEEINASTTQLLPDATTGSTSHTADAVASKTPVGPIVGGVAGGLAVLALAALLLFYRRRRRHNGSPSFKQKSMTQHKRPFMVPLPTTGTVPRARNVIPGTARTTSSFVSPELSSALRKGGIASSPLSSTATSSFTHPPSSQASSRPSRSTFHPRETILASATTDSFPRISTRYPSRNPFPRRETDAGPVPVGLDDYESDSATLPPEYEQVFRRSHAAGGPSSRPPLPPLPSQVRQP